MINLALVFTLASWHVTDRADVFNGFNPGVGVQIGRLSAGAYVNSFKRLSTYLTIGREWRQDRRVGLGVEAGVVTGYDWPVMPLVFPYVRLGGRGGWSMTLAERLRTPCSGFERVERQASDLNEAAATVEALVGMREKLEYDIKFGQLKHDNWRELVADIKAVLALIASAEGE